jgi:hypothetical protein
MIASQSVPALAPPNPFEHHDIPTTRVVLIQNRMNNPDDGQEENVIKEEDEVVEFLDANDSSANRLDSSQQPQNGGSSSSSSTTPIANAQNDDILTRYKKEVSHLRRRIKNIRESIQSSTVAVSSPSAYEQNVLNAVTNCLNEWRSIVSYFEREEYNTRSGGGIDSSSSFTDQKTKSTKEIALAMFELIQHSLQCGPLSGAKPGYFKRCGGDVALVVDQYLLSMFPEDKENENENDTVNDEVVLGDNDDAPDNDDEKEAADGEDAESDGNEADESDSDDDDESDDGPCVDRQHSKTPHQQQRINLLYYSRLGFTDRQASALETWKSSARKAANRHKSPSRSVLQSQKEARHKKRMVDVLGAKKKQRRLKTIRQQEKKKEKAREAQKEPRRVKA